MNGRPTLVGSVGGKGPNQTNGRSVDIRKGVEISVAERPRADQFQCRLLAHHTSLQTRAQRSPERQKHGTWPGSLAAQLPTGIELSLWRRFSPWSGSTIHSIRSHLFRAISAHDYRAVGILARMRTTYSEVWTFAHANLALAGDVILPD